MSDALFQAEKDSIVLLGLLSRAYLQFDPPIPVPSEPAPTHFVGLNIFGCIIDNADGEVLALDRNMIHAGGSPVEHGEQRALRAAIARVLVKRPRGPATTVEEYYRNQMFMAKGSAGGDFLRLGATCYTTLEPCPMCASTLLVSRMKRVVFVLMDSKYGGAWPDLKARFYAADEAKYDALSIDGTQSKLCAKVSHLNQTLQAKAAALRQAGTRDTLLLDHCRDELGQALDLLRRSADADLGTAGEDRTRNAAVLHGLKRSCNLPQI
jgi:tRNA(Arg) A34 adenosine deaminase TadA